jgi:glycerate dehydrogenase
MHILSLLGKGPHYDDCVKSGSYSAMNIFTDPSVCWTELEGRRMGIIGMGNIGKRVARIAEAFGMEVCYYSTSGTGHCTEYPSLSLEELLRTSDVVSIHAPLNERTAGLIGSKELEMMKETAIIVNMGRGGIVDETALADAVNEEKIAGAALDVFVKEPVPADNPLLHVRYPERLRLAPHVAWASEEARRRLVQQVADNIGQWIK